MRFFERIRGDFTVAPIKEEAAVQIPLMKKVGIRKENEIKIPWSTNDGKEEAESDSKEGQRIGRNVC